MLAGVTAPAWVESKMVNTEARNMKCMVFMGLASSIFRLVSEPAPLGAFVVLFPTTLNTQLRARIFPLIPNFGAGNKIASKSVNLLKRGVI